MTADVSVMEVLRRAMVLGLFGAWLIIRTKRGELVSFGRDRWHVEQAQFDDARTGMDLVLKGRQIGFTTIELARDVQYIVTHLGVQVVIVAHTLTAKRGIFNVVRRMVDACIEKGLLPRGDERGDANTVDEIVFASRASSIRVIEAGATAVSADDKGRSGTVNRLHITELAFYREPEATLKALRGAMPKDGSGEVVIESTPNGAAGLFYEMVMDALAGRGAYKLHFFAWYQHAEYRTPIAADFEPRPRDVWEERLRAKGCDDEQIQFWRDRVDARDEGGLEGALQEYPIDPVSCFRMMSGAYLDTELCDFVAANIVKPVRVEPVRVQVFVDGVAEERWPWLHLADCRVFADHTPGSEVVVSADTAGGNGGDSDSFVIRARDRRTFRLLASIKTNTMQPGDGGYAIAWMCRRYGNALAIPENNFDTSCIDRMLTSRSSVTPYTRIYIGSDGKHGWRTDKTSRPVMWSDWHDAIRNVMKTGEARGWFDSDAADELRTLVRVGGRPEAASGAHDDVWTADAIGLQARARETKQAPPPPGAGRVRDGMHGV